MKRIIILFLLTICSSTMVLCRPSINVTGLKCEGMEEPMGIDSESPRFSWILESTERNQKQSAYRIIVADSRESLECNVGNIWDSGKIRSRESILIAYKGISLRAAQNYYWKIKAWDKNNKESDWSGTATFSTGLFVPDNWDNAEWIGYERLDTGMLYIPDVPVSGEEAAKLALQKPVIPLFRKEFTLEHTIEQAQLFISGLGQYEVTINGDKVGDRFLAPGWTDYEKTVQYNVYDVTQQLHQGKNAIGVIVGNGFHNINRERYHKLAVTYGKPRMISKLKIVYTDGTEKIIVSGADWKSTSSPITFTSIYGGEDYDARLEQPGWDKSDFDDSEWDNAILTNIPNGKLIVEADYPVKEEDVFPVKTILPAGPDMYLYDFGQNASGIIELKVQGKRGQTIKLTPGELINSNQTINQVASGGPYYYSYTLKGDGVETWKPRFSYYGLRYCLVEGGVPSSGIITSEKGSEDKPQLIDLKLLHTRNSAPRMGTFSCSNQLFNQIYTLIDWGIKSNIQSILTDCPHREKLGWLEVSYLMGASMLYNYDLYNFYLQTVKNMKDAQTDNGLIPEIAPEYVVFQGGFRDSPEWGSAGIVNPWLIYKWYGDKEILKTAWPMMAKYMDHLATMSKDHLLSYGLGDWCDLGPNSPGFSQLTPIALTATAIYYYDAVLMHKTAKVLGYKNEEHRWKKLADDIKKAFNEHFFNDKTNVYANGSQTAMAMPLVLDMIDSGRRTEVMHNLVDSINQSGKALTAGDVGFHFLVKALEEGGQSQLLYEMNCRDDVPGYGYQLKKGATALTESWQGLETASNNHAMLGHLMEWFYTGLGGISQNKQSIAFKKITIKPQLVGDITEVKVSYQSPYGEIVSKWVKEKDNFTLNVKIPVNTTATVYIPTKDIKWVKEGGNPIKQAKHLNFLGLKNSCATFSLGSGIYTFSSVLN